MILFNEVILIITGIFCFFEVLLGIKFLVIKNADYTFHSSEVARLAALVAIKHEATVLWVAYLIAMIITFVIQA